MASYNTYTTTGGETIQSIAKKLGIKNWRNIVARNKKILTSGGYVKSGQKINTSVKSSPSSRLVDSLDINQIKEQFNKKYGMEQDTYDANGNLVQGIRPDEAFLQVAEQQVNPEQIRIARQQLGGYDLNASLTGGWRTGGSMSNRQNLVDSLDRARKEAVQQFIEPQNQLFNDWYNKELKQFGEAKNPNKYTLGKFGFSGLSGAPTYSNPNNNRYQYNTPFDYNSMFRYGGYSNSVPTYGSITPWVSPQTMQSQPRNLTL